MRSRLTILVSAAALLLAPLAAVAEDDVQEQLRLMNQRMEQMESQLQATQDELSASKEQVTRQNDVIQKAGLDREGESGMSSFFSAVEVGGWVAADWFWNFNNPGDDAITDQNLSQFRVGVNQGSSTNFYPFHPDHNSFSLSQLMIELEKPVTAESRGGFRADLMYGKTAGLLSAGLQRACGGFRDTGVALDDPDCKGDAASDFNLYQAYVQYLVPGLEATVKAGKFATITGAEVAPTVYNWNITRGFLYSAMQPITHTGVMVDGSMGGIDLGIGVANSGLSPAVDPDFNNAKTLLAKVGFGGETMSFTTNLVWGPEGINNAFTGDGGSVGLVDVVTTFDPSEQFSAWVNFDYLWKDGPLATANAQAWGVAVAGRLALSERAGFALRAEWAKDHRNLFELGSPTPNNDDVVWTLTGTFDYDLTDNLMFRAEARWDTVDLGGEADDEFIDNSDLSPAFIQKDQVVTGVELVYQF